MLNAINAGIRTAVQSGVAFLIAWAGSSLGADLAEYSAAIEGFLFAVLTGVVALVLNKMGQRFEWMNKLMSLGFSGGAVEYSTTPPPAPAPPAE